VMTCYKLVTAEFKWFGVQGRVENFIQKSERRLFTNFHRYDKYSDFLQIRTRKLCAKCFFRQVFCWMDRWHGLTMDDIRAIEDETKKELDKV